MRYFAIDLSSAVHDGSGKSANERPLIHIARPLFNYELFFGVDGELFLEQKGEYCVKKGEVLLHAKGEYQRGTRAAPCTFYWFHFDATVVECATEQEAKALCEGKEKWIFFAEYFVLSDMDRVLPLLAQLNHRLFEKGNELVRNALTAALLAELSCQYARGVTQYAEDRRFSEILGWIKLNYGEEFTVTELAAHFSYHPKYLVALFKRHTGYTVKGYLTRKRLDAAKRRLVQTTDAVKTIAREVGFPDEYYFMRLFKKDVGMSPTQYRKAFCGCTYT